MMKKATLLLAALTLTASLALAGCSRNTDNGGTGNNGQSGKEGNAATETDSGFAFGETPIEFSFYGHYDWYTMNSWGEDAATGWIKENKKVNVTSIQSGGNAQQKLSTMIASKTLPDVIWLDRTSDVERLREAGMLVPFDDWLDKYPNMKEWVGESTINLLRSPDGKIYQFPNWYTTQPNGNSGYVVNKRIYEELGSPKLETFDDLYEYLKRVKDTYDSSVVPYDPGIDGQGIELMVSGFANDFPTTYVSMRGVPEGDKLTSLFANPVYRETMQYANKLFSEKLITQDALTQTEDQVKERIYSDRVAVYAAASPTETASRAHSMVKEADPNHPGFMMVWPLHNDGVDKNKVWPGDWGQLGWNVSVITTNHENPEGIFAFLDWYTGEEGQRTIFWGPEGLYWEGTNEDGGPIFNDKYFAEADKVSELMNTTNNFQWNGNTVFIDTRKSAIEMQLPEEQRNWETRWQSEITWKTQFNSTPFINMAPPSDSDEGIIQQKINDIYLETFSKVLYAKSADEVISVLDKAEADAQNAGYEKLLAFQTKAWHENLQRMSAE
ncbi:extracellular solute-binding protein [Paenibacillaceae bacterium]|nr:extracellular solute-binding protein [Paenibacillaceae bacterium]